MRAGPSPREQSLVLAAVWSRSPALHSLLPVADSRPLPRRIFHLSKHVADGYSTRRSVIGDPNLFFSKLMLQGPLSPQSTSSETRIRPRFLPSSAMDIRTPCASDFRSRRSLSSACLHDIPRRTAPASRNLITRLRTLSSASLVWTWDEQAGACCVLMLPRLPKSSRRHRTSRTVIGRTG